MTYRVLSSGLDSLGLLEIRETNLDSAVLVSYLSVI